MEFYKTNKDFQDYVDNYCRKHKCTVEEALSHEIVKQVGEYYKDLNEK